MTKMVDAKTMTTSATRERGPTCVFFFQRLDRSHFEKFQLIFFDVRIESFVFDEDFVLECVGRRQRDASLERVSFQRRPQKVFSEYFFT